MCNNKARDCYGLHAENYKLAGDLYYSFLALCFNIMFTHGYIPVAATQTIICPCIKDKTVICLKSLIIDLLLWLLSFPKFMNIYF